MEKVYIRYSKEYPYLPDIVALSARELARKAGISVHTIYSSISQKIATYAIVEVDDDGTDNN